MGRKRIYPTTCTTEGCEGYHWAKGFCQKHYNKARSKKALGLPYKKQPGANILNNKAIEVLPSLLDKSKMQTIRLLKKTQDAWYGDDIDKMEYHPHYKKPRYEVGDIVRQVWDQTSKAKFFCKSCGGIPETIKGKSWCWMCSSEETFPKLFGTTEITEVFEIEMSKQDGHFYVMNETDRVALTLTYKLAELDGFKSVDEMFIWFNKNYDISKPNRFAVYRWKWLDENN